MAHKLILQNIVNEILKECKRMNIEHVDHQLCNFYVDLLMLDPNWGISDQIMRIRSDVQQFIHYVVTRLNNSEHPAMKALMIECHFESQFDHLEDSAKLHRLQSGEKLYSLKLAILEPDNKNDVDFFFEHLAKYIALASGLGDPTQIAVYKEVEVAVKSVLTIDELSEFWCELYTVRMERLSHLVKLVSGIRLYNKDCKRGGEGVPELPTLLLKAIDAVKDKIQAIHDKITEECLEVLTDVIKSCYYPSNTKYRVVLAERIPNYADSSDLEYCKDLLVLYKIYQEKLSKLVSEVDRIKQAHEKIETEYNEILSFLHEKVIPNMHMRASFIFPIFEHLFEEWCELQNRTVVLTELKHTFDNLYAMMSSMNLENRLINNFNPDNRSFCVRSFSPQKYMRTVKDGIVLLKKEYISFWAKMKKRYEYEGHCCWTLVTTKGFLIKGNDEYGIVKYKTKFYTFNSPYGLLNFISDPEYYIHHVLDLARKKCELIMYLRLKSPLTELQDIERIVEEDKTYVQVGNIGIQADSHRANKIEIGYESNIWRHKERALKMAVLLNCKTSSTQTGNSYNIVPKDTQTWLLKENNTQTMSDNHSNTPVPMQFFNGLRGRKDDKQVQMDFTSDTFMSIC
ncbi:unnamed protein product [Phaedon cochleariae]|uniref:Cilia- and flagella-associated protein 206 n=1 Tax=Phaedon cochleariae TaxID=80249 RepID=A0A9P0GLH7_PHACE|nr:unnamed protein product [Phaedon cochleariae]